MKVFLQAHLDTNCTQVRVRTTEDGEKSDVNTNYKDSLLNPYKTNKITIYIFSVCFSLKWHSLPENSLYGCIKQTMLEKTSKKLLVKYTIIITDVLSMKPYVIQNEKHTAWDKRLFHISSCDLLHWHEFW